jgi:SnoaL-like domain
MPTTEKTKIPVEDRFEIYDLFARCYRAWDCADGEGVADCFTPDGTMRLPEGDSYTGRDALIQMLATRTGTHNWRGTQHHFNHLLFEGGGDEYVVSCYYVTFRLDPTNDNSYVKGIGPLTSKCVRINGQWLLKERTALRWKGDAINWKGL